MDPAVQKKRFHILLIKPSRYDDDGYVIRWWKGVLTSNTLACMHALTKTACENGALGSDVEPVIHVYDETVQKIPVEKLGKELRKSGEKAVVCLVGVQSNQFPRAVDLARRFRAQGLKCMIGGFHVSGVVEMIDTGALGLKEAMQEGITLVAGEVEARWPEVLKAAHEGELAPLYNFVDDKPSLENVPGPLLPETTVEQFLNRQTSFDAGRGCPFKCSFCTIINIQGNTMRGRNADDIEKLIRANYARGYHHIFITDDNFARHPNWESIADRLIELKEKEGIRCSIKIQTDTMAHKIPRFIEKMTRAGVRRVFIGLESVNQENLRATGKYQNQLKEYRKMLQLWRDHGAVTYAGYIIGFPGDTYESIMQDVEFLKNEIPLEFPEFFIMTPLPGSKDHQKYYQDKVPMSEDMNIYDTTHVTMKHPKMTKEELERAYVDAWKSFYTLEHCKKLLLRRKGPRRRLVFSSLLWFASSIFISGVHPLMGGFFRAKGRKDRREGYPIEGFIPYYLKRTAEFSVYLARMLKMIAQIWLLNREAERPENADYMDKTIEPVPADPKKPAPAATAAIA